ncbi:MAG TPA: TlpA disulfide reductase family protein [Thiobacillaceae bacterium]|nr:TlpA disulfide reductase family protein [Thiobacillaceae bacterium]
MITLLNFLKKHAVTLLLVGLVTYIWFRPPATVTDENRPAAPYSVRMPDGQLLNSESLKGKVVLVNFWATWCPYCRKEMPAIEDFWQRHRAEGFEVLAVSVDDPPEKIAAYMKDAGYGFTAAAMDPSVLNTFGGVSTVPTSFIVDRTGVIRHKVAGQMHGGRLDDLVLPLLRAK